MRDKALKLIVELEAEMELDIYEKANIPVNERQSALLGRIGALQLAILKIKLAFDIPL